MARAGGRYAIIDEPRPGPLQKLAMSPILPFIAYMLFAPLGGALFFFNALALRGRTMLWELLFSLLGIVLLGSLMFVPEIVGWLIDQQWIGSEWLQPWGFALKYAMLLPLAIGMWCGYKIFLWQSATHEVLTYFDRADAAQGGKR